MHPELQTIKKHELLYFLQENNIELILIGEIWLKPKYSVHLPNFIIYRTDRLNGARGGTAICLHKSLPHIQQQTQKN